MKLDTIRVFAISKLSWIKQQQKQLVEQERETPREYLDRESHYVWGQRYLLKHAEASSVTTVDLHPRELILRVRPGLSVEKKQEILDAWYRAQLKEAISMLIAKWEPLIGVNVERFYVQRMKTRWGSCNHRRHTIRLNTELARKPRECLEYIVVHEMLHILEPAHNARFLQALNNIMPNWQYLRDILNQLPVRHENWRY